MINYKLGKLAPKSDTRDLRFHAMLRESVIPPLPPAFDVDTLSPCRVPIPMLANDKYGCCVIAERGHYTLCAEAVEQKHIIPLTDADVVGEYLRETGGADNGLVILDSLKAWRAGWEVGGRQYNIYAFARLNPADRNDIKAAIFLLGGVCVGLELPLSAQEQLEAGKVWAPACGRKGKARSWGGHCVLLCGYDKDGLTCVTWGKKQRMTWSFFTEYCDEAFAVVDNRDDWLGDTSPIDIPWLDTCLHDIALTDPQ
jgi:hypothetical protein